MSHSPVLRETFLQQASFYSNLSTTALEDCKFVLIRLPKEISAADLDGKTVELGTGGDAIDDESIFEKVIGRIEVDLRSKSRSSCLRSISKSISKSKSSSNVSNYVSNISNSNSTTLYTLKSSRRNLKVNSLAITQPSSNVTSLTTPQQMRLGRNFDEFWNLNLGVEIEEAPIKKITKIVKKRAELPLVEQPKNLRMRLLPFSSPISAEIN